MENSRKKYVNIGRLSSGNIFALLDSIESDDKGDIENIMNDSDTDFVAEKKSVVSTSLFSNIIRKEEIGDQNSSVSFSEASTHILSTEIKGEINTLGQVEQNSAPATQRTFSQSPSPATQRTSNCHLFLPINVLPISHLLLPLNVLTISHLLLLLLLDALLNTETFKRLV